MARIGNSKGATSDVRPVRRAAAGGGGYAGGRRTRDDGMKGAALRARAGCLAAKAAFRAGQQDARREGSAGGRSGAEDLPVGAASAPGPASPSALQLKTRRVAGRAERRPSPRA